MTGKELQTCWLYLNTEDFTQMKNIQFRHADASYTACVKNNISYYDTHVYKKTVIICQGWNKTFGLDILSIKNILIIVEYFTNKKTFGFNVSIPIFRQCV